MSKAPASRGSIESMTRTAVIYARISKSASDGLGIERQLEACRELASSLGWNVTAELVDDGISAWDARKTRPKYAELLRLIESGAVTGVVAWHTDRLHRQSLELHHYATLAQRCEVVTHTVTGGPVDLSTPTGLLQASVAGAVAQYESSQKAERIKAQKRQARESGKWKGGARPYGYEADGITVREGEAQALLAATEAIVAGASLRSVVEGLNLAGPTSTGRAHLMPSTRRLLLRVRNIGQVEIDGEPAGAAEWKAIVPEETWRACRAVLQDPSRRTNFAGPGPKYLLSSLATCAVCGAHVISHKSSGNRRDYICSSTPHVSRNVEGLDDLVRRVIEARLALPDVARLLAPADDGGRLRAAQSEVLQLREREGGLALAYAEGQITAAQLSTGSAELRRRREEAEAIISARAQASSLSRLLTSASPVDAFRNGTLDLQRAVIEALVEIRLHKAPRGRKAAAITGRQAGIDPKYVEITWKAGE